MTTEEHAVSEPLQTAVARCFAACAVCIGGAATFFLVSVTAWPLPLYQPLVRRWVLSGAQRPLELSMDYYGRSLYALLGGAAAGLLAYGYARWRLRRSRPEAVPDPTEESARPPSPSSTSVPALWLPLLYAATALAFATALFAYQLWGRATFPEPLPATSVPLPATSVPLPATSVPPLRGALPTPALRP